MRKTFAVLLGASVLGNIAGGEWSNALMIAMVFVAVAWPWLPALRRPDETVTMPPH